MKRFISLFCFVLISFYCNGEISFYCNGENKETIQRDTVYFNRNRYVIVSKNTTDKDYVEVIGCYNPDKLDIESMDDKRLILSDEEILNFKFRSPTEYNAYQLYEYIVMERKKIKAGN